MLTSKQQEQKSKQRKIRNSEYYDMISTFDELYADSKKDKIFNHLMEIIESEENIKLAYRTIKTNTGSTNLRASWEFHCFSMASAAFHKVFRSAYSGGAWGGSMISVWTISLLWE